MYESEENIFDSKNRMLYKLENMENKQINKFVYNNDKVLHFRIDPDCATEYKYFIRMTDDGYDSLLRDIAPYINSGGNYDNTLGKCIFFDGVYDINNIHFFARNGKKGHYNSLDFYFKSRDDAVKFENFIKELEYKHKKNIGRPIFTYVNDGWRYSEKYGKFDRNNYFGHDDYLNQILNDISNIKKHSEFLDDIGEGNKSLNYLLHGLPGTGKTTLVKIIANELQLPIYIVSSLNLNFRSVNELLSPVDERGETIIVLLEDFDRILSEHKISMDELLNALDGIQNKNNIIRFFTGNKLTNNGILFDNLALMSRFNRVFEYGKPTEGIFLSKFNQFLKLYDNVDEVKKNKFINMVKECNNITIRSFSNYVKLYIFNKDTYMDDLINNIRFLDNSELSQW